MQGSTLVRSLLVSVALVVAGPAMAQGDKDPSTASKPNSAKSATKPAAAAKRLDFVPANAVKPATTRAPASTSQPAPAPAMPDAGCHGHDSEA
jgi:hypothetical protein